ncbi:replication initiation factor domain-containing protein [Vibrio variabilis]|uniref:replication initiation factor domain-containing protein n=1 Tax=Vibrio variabilis TaxID=990271 RepID=UPI000DD82D10|nr:replication initiation factor domain-containing protein [Vibrio variabilis]
MNTATQILENATFQPQKEQISIDFLCFTFAIKDLRHCYTAYSNLKHRPKRGAILPVVKEKHKSLLQRHHRTPEFPAPPQFNPTLAKCGEDIDAYTQAFQSLYRRYLEDCLVIFTNRVLGLSLSAPRGLGFQYYTDSMKLTSPNGEDFCGFIGIGGNNDTVHFQINGTGCKHVFAHRQPWAIHDWLSNVLGVQQLARVDLAYDDYDGLFDCEYARKAWHDNAFRTSVRGRAPKLSIGHDIERMDNDGKPVYSKEQYSIGSRTSRVYWRIYNKALEQNLAATGLTWYRSEVELKKWNVDVLLDPSGAFAALNDFAASISVSDAFNTKPQPTKKAACDLLTASFWMRRQYGKTLNSFIEFHNGDVHKAVGQLIRDGSRYSFPDTYGKLVEHILET